MNKNVKNQKSVVFFVILAVTLALTQFQTLPASASFTFSTEKITVPNSDRFGWTIQKLDNGFAVGEPYAGSDDSGLVRIFDSNGILGPTIPNPGASSDNFGYSLSALGGTLAVGAPGTNSNSGTVYLFDISSPTAPTQSIQNPTGSTDERMGEDQMNFLGGDLLVGISKATNNLHPSAGIIYQFSSSDGSIINHYNKPDGINDNDLFGKSIAVREPLILTGAHGVLGETGEAHVFGASNLISIANPNSNPTQNDQFGWSTGITSDKYIIGAPGTEVVTYPSNHIVPQGVVYLFDKVSLAKSIFTSPDGADIDFGQNIDDHFGYDVAASDNFILIGAPYDDVEKDGITYINAGSAYLFQDGNLIESFHNPDPANGDFFGQSVEIFNGQLIIGAPGDAGGAGAVYYTKISNPFAAKLDIAADPNPVAAGDDVTFTYTITNIGTADFTSVDNDPTTLITVTDNDCLGIDGPFGDTADATLNVGEAWTFTCTKPAPTNPFTEAVDEGSTSITFDNNGTPQTLTCQDAEFPCNPVDVNIVSSGLTMTISADPQPAINGQTVNVVFDVFNTGTVSLFIEGTGGVVDNNANCTPIGENPDLIELEAQANTHFTCQVTATNLPITIDAVITARDSVSNQVITATAQYPLDILKTEIALDITSNPDPTYNGEQTTITYLVTNIGDLPLDIDGQTGVIESNPACTPVYQSGPLTMQPNDSVTFACTVTGGTSPINLSATATTLNQINNEITATSTFTLNSIAPEITLDITSNPDPTYNGASTVITYNVTNTGDSVLTIDQSAISESNPSCTPVYQSGLLTMQPNDSVTFACTITGGTSPINLSATATTLDENHRTVTASDQLVLNIINPAITLDISAVPNPVNSGSISTVTYLVTNTGDSVLTIDQSAILESNPACTPVYQSGPLTMQPNDSVTFACTITGGTSPINLSATATTLNQINNEITASATFTLNSIAPEIALDITSNPDPTYNGASTIITYNVTNTGDSVLTIDQSAILESNPACTPVYQSGPLTMQPNDSVTFACTITGGTSPINLSATATTLDENHRTVTASDQLVLQTASLTLDIVPVPLQPLIGSSPIIKFIVTNNGSSIFDTITVDETLNAFCTPTSTSSGPLNPGNTRTFECIVPNVTGDFGIQGVATGTYIGGQFVVQKVITVDVISELFCGKPKSDYGTNVFEGGSGNDNLTGTNGDDLIIGNDGNDKIKGKDGNDCIIGGNGDDKLWGGKGNDTIEGNAGNDNIYGQDGNDTLTGGDGDDKLWGGKGNDTIEGNAGKDQIHGQDGNDIITGADGDDKIWGGQGNDLIDTGTGNDRVNGNQGDDTIVSGDGNDWINAGIGNDIVNAGLGDDKIFGNQGNDNLFGEAGADIIHGGQGNDLLNGGPNNDQCYGGQGTNTFVDCESQKPMNEDNEDAEEEEETENNDNSGNNSGNHGNDNSGNNSGNHGNDNSGNDKDNKDKKK